MSLADLISRSFWESRGLDFPLQEFQAYPTMLTLEEMRMLYAIAAHPSLPSGDICDLGSFMGGSSISLASGVVASGRDRRVHSYDRFVFNQAQFDQYLARHPQAGELRGVGFGVELFRRLTRRYASVIDVYSGDFMDQPAPEQIALLFIDLDKSIELNKAVLEFFRRLVPGSIVVQQDFFFSKTPWTVVTMHRLRDVVVFRGGTKSNSAVFEVTEPPGDERIAGAAAQGMTAAEVEAAYHFFIEKSPRMYHQEILQAGLHRYRQQPAAASTHEFDDFAGRRFYKELLASQT